MATAYKEGDRVQIVDRAVTADDSKTGLYYDYFRGLTGTIQKLYTDNQAAIEIELDSLSEPIAHRHHDVQEQMKSKWLDGLSEEARNRLTEQERDFRLRYTVLVSTADLAAPGRKPAARQQEGSQKAHSEKIPAVEPAPRRATSNDLSAAEEAELMRRQRQG